MKRFIRETAFRVARGDLARFIDDHEDNLLCIFREEMENLDARLPEEQMMININMVALGDELLRAVLKALRRFLTDN